MIQGILNGRALSTQYLQPDGSYHCDPLWTDPAADGVVAWEYQLSARVTGSPTGGGVQAWFSRILPTSGNAGVQADSETNDAHGATVQRLSGRDTGLLPQGDWAPFAVPFNAANDTIVTRSILNVPHVLCLKGAFTGGTAPDAKITLLRTALAAVPSRPPALSTPITASLDLSASVRYLTGWQFAENAGTPAAARVQFRDGTAAGTVVRDIRIALGDSREADYDRPIYFPNGVYVLVSAGTVRGSVEGF